LVQVYAYAGILGGRIGGCTGAIQYCMYCMRSGSEVFIFRVGVLGGGFRDEYTVNTVSTGSIGSIIQGSGCSWGVTTGMLPGLDTGC